MNDIIGVIQAGLLGEDYGLIIGITAGFVIKLILSLRKASKQEYKGSKNAIQKDNFTVSMGEEKDAPRTELGPPCTGDSGYGSHPGSNVDGSGPSSTSSMLTDFDQDPDSEAFYEDEGYGRGDD